MAKKKAREFIGFACKDCKQQNYVSERNKLNTPEALELRKFCNNCRKVTAHKQMKKLD